ncbi:hypothetical protein EJ08DRAFT_693732 [Tothia fuscella]|uniref:Secreted protein n=1 Tax=Tothia fuscella TaxID=1048955 RepID=A0A9P4NXF6_9PEZI|nr:hypothetical protein EJ08DRAFT_693732 [Tothia fuscella]
MLVLAKIIAAFMLASQVSAAAQLSFYYNYVANLNCGGAALNTLPLTTACVDIDAKPQVDMLLLGSKRWVAMKASGMDAGCHVETYQTTDCSGAVYKQAVNDVCIGDDASQSPDYTKIKGAKLVCS